MQQRDRNRMLALLRANLRKCARDWDRLDRAPAVRLLKEPSRQTRFLSRGQACTLLCEPPRHLRDIATLTLVTGLRAEKQPIRPLITTR
jgi:hypothetical protein